MAGGAEDDEPDKLAIAFGRFGRLKRFIGGSIRVSVTSFTPLGDSFVTDYLCDAK